MLAYDQPITRSKPDAGPKPARTSAGLNVSQLVHYCGDARPRSCGGADRRVFAVAIGKSLTPKYLATAQLYVDPRELQLVDRELTPRSQDISGLAMVVESQARLITSNSVLMQVIQDTHLDKDPEFGGGSSGLMANLFGLFGLEMRQTGSSRFSVRPRRSMRSTAISTSRRPIAPLSSTSRSGRMIRPRRRCSPMRFPPPIWRKPGIRSPSPHGAPPAICRAD